MIVPLRDVLRLTNPQNGEVRSVVLPPYIGTRARGI